MYNKLHNTFNMIICILTIKYCVYCVCDYNLFILCAQCRKQVELGREIGR